MRKEELKKTLSLLEREIERLKLDKGGICVELENFFPDTILYSLLGDIFFIDVPTLFPVNDLTYRNYTIAMGIDLDEIFLSRELEENYEYWKGLRTFHYIKRIVEAYKKIEEEMKDGKFRITIIIENVIKILEAYRDRIKDLLEEVD